jgi:hypothetical protein
MRKDRSCHLPIRSEDKHGVYRSGLVQITQNVEDNGLERRINNAKSAGAPNSNKDRILGAPNTAKDWVIQIKTEY